MNPGLIRQVLAVYRMELRKAFLARRGLWVYLLALLPVLRLLLDLLLLRLLLVHQ